MNNKIEAYKCPYTGQIFEDYSVFKSHIENIENINKTRVEKDLEKEAFIKAYNKPRLVAESINDFIFKMKDFLEGIKTDFNDTLIYFGIGDSKIRRKSNGGIIGWDVEIIIGVKNPVAREGSILFILRNFPGLKVITSRLLNKDQSGKVDLPNGKFFCYDCFLDICLFPKLMEKKLRIIELESFKNEFDKEKEMLVKNSLRNSPVYKILEEKIQNLQTQLVDTHELISGFENLKKDLLCKISEEVENEKPFKYGNELDNLKKNLNLI